MKVEKNKAHDLGHRNIREMQQKKEPKRCKYNRMGKGGATSWATTNEGEIPVATGCHRTKGKGQRARHMIHPSVKNPRGRSNKNKRFKTSKVTWVCKYLKISKHMEASTGPGWVDWSAGGPWVGLFKKFQHTTRKPLGVCDPHEFLGGPSDAQCKQNHKLQSPKTPLVWEVSHI